MISLFKAAPPPPFQENNSTNWEAVEFAAICKELSKSSDFRFLPLGITEACHNIWDNDLQGYYLWMKTNKGSLFAHVLQYKHITNASMIFSVLEYHETKS